MIWKQVCSRLNPDPNMSQIFLDLGQQKFPFWSLNFPRACEWEKKIYPDFPGLCIAALKFGPTFHIGSDETVTLLRLFLSLVQMTEKDVQIWLCKITK